MEIPSSKAVTAFLGLFVVGLTAFVEAAEVQGVDLPPWMYLVLPVVAAIAVYQKRENRPPSSAWEARQ